MEDVFFNDTATTAIYTLSLPRRSSDLIFLEENADALERAVDLVAEALAAGRSEEHASELQSLRQLVCRLLLEKKNVPEHPLARHRAKGGDSGRQRALLG